MTFEPPLKDGTKHTLCFIVFFKDGYFEKESSRIVPGHKLYHVLCINIDLLILASDLLVSMHFRILSAATFELVSFVDSA